MLADWFPNQVDWMLVEVRRKEEGEGKVGSLVIIFYHLYIYFDHHHHDAMGGRSA